MDLKNIMPSERPQILETTIYETLRKDKSRDRKTSGLFRAGSGNGN